MNSAQTLLRASRWAGLIMCLSWQIGCETGSSNSGSNATTSHSQPARASSRSTPLGLEDLPQTAGVASGVTPQVSTSASAAAALSPVREPWNGPYLGVTRSSAGIYISASTKRDGKLGYAQEGALVPIKPNTIKGEGCDAGYYEVVDGGYICADHGTTQADDPRITNAPKQPDLSSVLPFTYARNSRNGAPLYRAVPSREQQKRYEPYLFKDELEAEAVAKASGTKTAASAAPAIDAPKPPRKEQSASALYQAQLSMLGEEALKKLQAAEPTVPLSKPQPQVDDPGVAPVGQSSEDDRKWWQKDNVDPSSIKLADLSAEGDDILAQRLVKGFFIAVDRKFQWNGRQWFRSTKGFVAPSDTFGVTAGPKFQGVVLDSNWHLPVGWVVGYQKTRNTYEIDVPAEKVKIKGQVKRLSAVNLTGKEVEIGKHAYVQAADETWLRKDDLRITTPGPTPADLQPEERWLDINLTTQTAVLFVGTTPIYATLISSGKTHSQKDLDHSTPTGEWRIREKHITSTMDGDGTAAGDMPYSIEAVPYVMFFHRSYAVHGAFWHENYGVKMSHGCVNMSPLDAKYIFFHTDPPVPQGWQGAWSSDDRPGSRVVIHE